MIKIKLAAVAAVMMVAGDEPLSLSAGWTAEGGQAQALFGSSVAPAGDVNGDGFADVVVGAPSFDTGDEDEGRVYVFAGSPAGLSPEPIWTAEGDQPYAYFGARVAGCGDVNGDGYDDILIGAPYAGGDFEEEGRAYVYFGGPAGPPAVADWVASGGQAGANFGSSVAAAGDVDGDGYDDILVGAEGFSGAFQAEGRASLFFGSPSGPPRSPDWTADGGRAYARLGSAVAGAGDVNGDGYDDVAAGAYYYGGAYPREGRVFVFHGSSHGPAAQPDWIADGGSENAFFGGAIAAAGDVDGDGYGDLAVGVWGYDESYAWEGAVYVFSGSPSGLSNDASWVTAGGQENAFFGSSVATAGDLDGDGFSDLVVGSPTFRIDGVSAGRVFVYLGSAAGLSTEAAWLADGDREGAMFGACVARSGDVAGDGGVGLIVGEEGEGRAHLFWSPGPVVTTTSQEETETETETNAGAAPIGGRSSGHGCSLFAAERSGGIGALALCAAGLILLGWMPRATPARLRRSSGAYRLGIVR